MRGLAYRYQNNEVLSVTIKIKREHLILKRDTEKKYCILYVLEREKRTAPQNGNTIVWCEKQEMVYKLFINVRIESTHMLHKVPLSL